MSGPRSVAFLPNRHVSPLHRISGFAFRRGVLRTGVPVGPILSRRVKRKRVADRVCSGVMVAEADSFNDAPGISRVVEGRTSFPKKETWERAKTTAALLTLTPGGNTFKFDPSPRSTGSVDPFHVA